MVNEVKVKIHPQNIGSNQIKSRNKRWLLKELNLYFVDASYTLPVKPRVTQELTEIEPNFGFSSIKTWAKSRRRSREASMLKPENRWNETKIGELF